MFSQPQMYFDLLGMKGQDLEQETFNREHSSKQESGIGNFFSLLREFGFRFFKSIFYKEIWGRLKPRSRVPAFIVASSSKMNLITSYVSCD